MFFSLVSYKHVETASGSVTTSKGVSAIVPAHAGVIETIMAREGQPVAAGAPLVRIRATSTLSNGEDAGASLLRAIRAQDDGLSSQSRQLELAAAAERARQGAVVAGLSREIASIDDQIALQQQLVESSKADLSRAQDVAKNGFVSARDVQAREEAWLLRRQHYAQLQASRSSKLSAIAEAQRLTQQIAASARGQAAALSASRSELSQRSVSLDVAQAFVISAPVAGQVTAVTARVGQTVSPQAPIMAIIPQGAALTAELEIPTRAAGFIREGQEVRLAIDAFPYERFGTVLARISSISRSTVARSDDAGNRMPVYLAMASIADPAVVASGRKQPLLPGMMLRARIVTGKRSMMDWLFAPLLAVWKR